MARLHGKDKSKIDKYKRNLKKFLSFMVGMGRNGANRWWMVCSPWGGRRRSMARLKLFLAGVVGVNEGVVVLLDFGGILGEATLLVGFYGFGEEFV